MKKLLLFLSAIVATVSCTNEIAETPNMEEATTQKISVAVAANSTSDTRVDLTDDGENGYTVSWNAADQLGAWGTGDTAYYQSKFTIASDTDYDAENSTFTGELPYNTTEIRFIHPYSATFSQTSGVVSMSLASQSVASDLSNLSSNTYMVSNAFEVESVTSTTSDTKSDISMSHLGAAIDLRIKLDDSSDFTLTQLVVSELPTAAEVDMTNDATLTVTKTGAITLAMDNIASVDGIATASFNSFPFTLADGEALSFEATLFDSNDTYYTATATITASDEVAFSRATRNTVYVKLSDVVAAETPQETITITHDDFSSYSNSYTTLTGEIELDGADFYANSIYAYNSTYVSALTSGYLFNLTSLEGLSKLVISYQNSNYFTVYEGSAVNPLASVVTPSVDEDTYVCTYEITEGNTFFTIVRETSSYVNAYSIVAHYDTLGATSGVPAQFTGLNPSTITFDSDDTTAQTVTINGSYLENGSISVSVDSSNFVVSSVNTDDYTFTVAPTAANNTDAIYSATVTVTVDETEYTVAVSQVSANVTEAAGLTVACGEFYDTSGNLIADGESNGNAVADLTLGVYKFDWDNSASKYYDNGTAIRMYSSSSLTISTTDGSYITSIEVGISSGDALLSTEDGLYNSTDKTWQGTASSVTFKSSGNAAYIQSFKINGGSPVITGFDPSSIAFDSDDTVPQEVTIVGEELDDAEITVDCDSDNFTVVYTSGTTFTVAPASSNTSGATYTATITATVDGKSATMEVSQLAEGEVAPTYVLVESVDDITDGEYLLACEYDSAMYIANGTVSSSTFVCVTDSTNSYNSDTKSFTSNDTIDGYAVTIEAMNGGYYIQMSSGNYLGYGGTGTGVSSSDTSYAWILAYDDTYKVYLTESTTASTPRHLAYNKTTGLKAYAASNLGSYSIANLYKKVTE